MPWDNTSRRRTELPRDWSVIRRDVLNRDHHTCQLAGPHCTTNATEVDHAADRHDHTRTNLRAACHTCHTERTTTQGHQAARQARQAARHPTEQHPGMTGATTP